MRLSQERPPRGAPAFCATPRDTKDAQILSLAQPRSARRGSFSVATASHAFLGLGGGSAGCSGVHPVATASAIQRLDRMRPGVCGQRDQERRGVKEHLENDMARVSVPTAGIQKTHREPLARRATEPNIR